MTDSSPAAASAASPGAVPTRWRAILLTLLAGSVCAAQIGKLPAALPAIRADLGIGLVTAGWIISTIVLIGVLGGVAAGTVGDRFGHRRVVVGSILIAGIGSLAGAFAPATAWLIASRAVEGIGYIGMVAVAPAIIARAATERDRPLAIGIWAFYMPVGMATMVALSSPLMDAVGGWRGLWLINGGLALAAFALLATALRGPQFAHRPGPVRIGAADVWRTLRAPAPWVIAFSMGCYSLVYLSSMAFLPTYLIERLGMARDTAGLLIGLAVFMNAPGCLAGGLMMRHGLRPWIGIAAGYCGMAVCAFGLYQPDIPFGLRYGLALALPFFGGFIPPIVISRAQAHAPSPALHGTAVGLVLQIVSLGQFTGPPVLAALVAATGDWQSGAWLTVGACAVGLAMAMLLRRLERTREGGPLDRQPVSG